MRSQRPLGEQLWEIYKNGPVYPGDTISHNTAYELLHQGLTTRNKDGDFIITEKGRRLIEVLP